MLPLELPVPEVPEVAQLFYQPVRGRVVPPAAALHALKRAAMTAAVDGSALALAVALRDLDALGVGASDEVLTTPRTTPTKGYPAHVPDAGRCSEHVSSCYRPSIKYAYAVTIFFSSSLAHSL